MQEDLGNQRRPPGSFDPMDAREYQAGPAWRRRRWDCGGGATPRVFGAIFLIVAGVLLFLDDIGILRVHNIWDFWPLVLVGIGFSRLVTARSMAERFFGIVVGVFGVLFLLLTLHVVNIPGWDRGWPIGLMLVGFGLVALMRSFEAGIAARPRVGFPAQAAGPSNDFIEENTVAGNVKRRVETTNFLGGSLTCYFGNIDLDLRRAQIGARNQSVRLDINCFCGGAKIRVPDSWVVSLRAPAILGNVEDKTLPPRTVAGVDPPTLVITGQSVLGSIETEN
ncbi:MAG: hypothetical protein JO091_07870 [Acidobacteriaceae bacterium]|nr:hypothetical protein [Acidobacteriaceae bacterium]